MEIRTWSNFSKRKNSTAQPTGGTAVNVVLKEDTSIHDPAFIFNEPMPAYTYIQAFGRYYFVTDVTNLDAHRSLVSCTLDALATYKSDILSYNAFVERSASNYDIYLRDPAVSIQQKYISDTTTTTSITSILNKSGMYVASVMSKNYGLMLYCTNTLEVYKGILNSGCYDASDISDWITSKISAAFDLDVYIGSVKWMPLNLGMNMPALTDVSIGPVTIKPAYLPAGLVKKAVAPTAAFGVNVPITLPGAYFNDFRDADPRFVQYSITLPGIGTAPLDAAFVGSCILNGTTLNDQIAIDISTGAITHMIESGSVRFCDFRGTIAVDVPLGKARGNIIETLTTFIGGTSAAASSLAGGGGSPGSVIGGVGTSLVTGLQTIESAYTPQVSIIGGTGNHYDLYLNCDSIKINRKIFGSKTFPLSVAGRPLMQYATLSSLSGFVKCGNASVPVNARDQERDEINSYLNSGIYIE